MPSSSRPDHCGLDAPHIAGAGAVAVVLCATVSLIFALLAHSAEEIEAATNLVEADAGVAEDDRLRSPDQLVSALGLTGLFSLVVGLCGLYGVHMKSAAATTTYLIGTASMAGCLQLAAAAAALRTCLRGVYL
eukprot:TRINITY_DN21206_c0_g1_i2.p1 TRINITY_DN21206_c0_g1~~TRINITY_DN21206_c0_g1_i2.p1  ORF type:complete len:133 (+),score=23.48 TRINITY_DN21206_c0_g1_i2:179-577(+)